MAGALMGRRGGGRGRRNRPMSEINVTPFVDVVLVLLIIFMVAAPLMTVGVPVNLPRANGTPLAQEQEPLTVSVDSQGRIFLQETEVPMDSLLPQLRAILQSQQQSPQASQAEPPRIFVRGDSANSYGRVLEVLGAVRESGFLRIGLISDPPQGRPTAQPSQQSRPPAAQPARPATQPGR
jgi:biopolymer transport protein TolR